MRLRGSSSSDTTTTNPVVVAIEEDPLVMQRMLGALDACSVVVDAPRHHLEEFLDVLPGGDQPTILVLGPSQADDGTLGQLGALVHLHPWIGALLVVATSDTSVLRAALRAGVRDAVPLERVRDDLPPAVQDLRLRLEAGQGAAEKPSSPGHAASPPGRVVSVFSAKGGVGKSTVAVNLATELASRGGQRVVLVDADLQFGDVGVMLRLRPDHGLMEAIAAGDRLDPVLLDRLLLNDPRSGLSVLPAPTDPTAGAKITPQQISNLVGQLREMGAITVIDMPSLLDDIVLQLLAESDDIVYLVGTDVPAVKNARLGLQAVELVQIPLGRVLVVLNRADVRGQLPARDIEKILGMQIDFSLPADDLVPRTVNEGIPAVVTHAKSRFSGRVRAMAELLLARSSAEATK